MVFTATAETCKAHLHSTRFRVDQEGGNLRYKPMQDTILTTPKRNARLAQLWDDLLADPVSPRPAAKQGMTVDARFERNYAASLPLASDREGPYMLSEPETMRDGTGLCRLEEAERMEPVHFNGTDISEPVSRSWRVDLAKLFHNLLENVEFLDLLSMRQFRGGRFQTCSKAADEEILSLSSPFRWEPKSLPDECSCPVKPSFLTHDRSSVLFDRGPKFPSAHCTNNHSIGASFSTYAAG